MRQGGASSALLFFSETKPPGALPANRLLNKTDFI